LVQKNKAAFFAPVPFVINSVPISVQRNLVGLELNIDFYHIAAIFVRKDCYNDPSFSAIVERLLAQIAE